MMQTPSIGTKGSSSFLANPGARWIKRWGGFFIGLFIIWLLMAFIGPWGRQTAMLSPIMDVIEERGIDATAYYYTDLEEFAEAEINITHTMRFTPTGPAE